MIHNSYFVVLWAVWTYPYFILARNVLLIGDSVDRYIVSDWCSMDAYMDGIPGSHANPWGDGSIKYGDKTKQPALFCRRGNNTLSSLHVFGSAPYGPYLWVENTRDRLANTVPRIEKALALYQDQIGMPDIILFTSILWDIRPLVVSGAVDYLNDTSVEWNETISTFRKNTNDRILGIKKLSNQTTTLVGFRTNPRIHRGRR